METKTRRESPSSRDSEHWVHWPVTGWLTKQLAQGTFARDALLLSGGVALTRSTFVSRVRELYAESVVSTTVRTDGLESLKAALREHERARRPAVTVRVPVTDGARLAFLYRSGDVLHRESVNGRVEIRVRLAQETVDQLRAEGVEVEG